MHILEIVSESWGIVSILEMAFGARPLKGVFYMMGERDMKVNVDWILEMTFR